MESLKKSHRSLLWCVFVLCVQLALTGGKVLKLNLSSKLKGTICFKGMLWFVRPLHRWVEQCVGLCYLRSLVCVYFGFGGVRVFRLRVEM